jgi:diacylglycerol kinase (ATP)
MLNIAKLVKSFGYAIEGLRYSFKFNQNIKIHIFAAFIAIIASFFLGLDNSEVFDVCILIVFVISAEMINTSIEEVINLLVNEHRLEAKIAKDVSAGMVLLIAMFAAIVGVFIFVPHILALFK